MALLAKYTIYGEPAPKKNSKSITFRGGRPALMDSKRYRKWANAARAQLKLQKREQFTKTLLGKVRLKMTFYKAFSNSPDLSNLYEGPQDLLQEMEIIGDDNQIQSHDESRMFFLCIKCPDRLKYKRDCAGGKKGTFKADCGKKRQCPYNRAEMEIHSMRVPGLPKDAYTNKFDMLKKLESDIQEDLAPPTEDFNF